MERAEERLLEMFSDVVKMAPTLTDEEIRSILGELIGVTLMTGRVQTASLFLTKKETAK